MTDPLVTGLVVGVVFALGYLFGAMSRLVFA